MSRKNALFILFFFKYWLQWNIFICIELVGFVFFACLLIVLQFVESRKISIFRLGIPKCACVFVWLCSSIYIECVWFNAMPFHAPNHFILFIWFNGHHFNGSSKLARSMMIECAWINSNRFPLDLLELISRLVSNSLYLILLVFEPFLSCNFYILFYKMNLKHFLTKIP